MRYGEKKVGNEYTAIWKIGIREKTLKWRNTLTWGKDEGKRIR